MTNFFRLPLLSALVVNDLLIFKNSSISTAMAKHIGLFSTYDASFGNTIELLRNFIFKSHFRSRNRLLIGFNIISFNHPHNCQFNWNLNELTFSTLGMGALCAHMLCARERDEYE